MPNLALRKTVEGFSAGTVVELEQPLARNDEVMTVHRINDNYIFDVEITDLVELRSRTVMVPKPTRKEKRAKIKKHLPS